jgi:hypothetical protein
MDRTSSIDITEESRSAGSLAQEVVHRLQTLGLLWGREDSFKLGPRRLLADRMLVGVQAASMSVDVLLHLSEKLGMPTAAKVLLAARLPLANAVFFGTEEDDGERICKIYLEFWDEVRQAVRKGARDPQLLHFGVKWSSARAGHFEQAQYVCHPLLGARDVLRRMGDAYPEDGTATAGKEIARSIVRRGLRRAPQAAFLYLDASEAGNPRRSFDINLYKAGLHVKDVDAELRQAAANFGLAEEAMEAQLQRLGSRPLGHISGGLDRRGEEFLSVYAEIQPLPEPG